MRNPHSPNLITPLVRTLIHICWGSTTPNPNTPTCDCVLRLSEPIFAHITRHIHCDNSRGSLQRPSKSIIRASPGRSQRSQKSSGEPGLGKCRLWFGYLSQRVGQQHAEGSSMMCRRLLVVLALRFAIPDMKIPSNSLVCFFKLALVKEATRLAFCCSRKNLSSV